VSYRPWCNNEREHEDEGRRDYDRRGVLGYDQQRYFNRYWDACDDAYMRGFEQARRDEDRRREERVEEEAYERRRQAERDYEREREEYYD
jgi:hypothetical protein